jgi:hypothetical protein
MTVHTARCPPKFGGNVVLMRTMCRPLSGVCEMRTLLNFYYDGLRLVPLRGLSDPVRLLAEALEEIAIKLQAELDNPLTSERRRAEILERLALLRSISAGR